MAACFIEYTLKEKDEGEKALKLTFTGIEEGQK
jgi:hypothetical protein